MKRYTFLLIVLAMLGMSVQAQNEPKKFTLSEAVDYALKNNDSLKIAKLDALAAQKRVNEVLASGLPQVNATGSFMNNTQIPTQVLPNFLKPIFIQGGVPGANNMSDVIAAQFGQPFTASGSITASQLIFDGSFLMGVKATSTYKEAAQLNVKRSENDVKVNVSKMYCSVLLLQINIAMLDTNLKTLEKLNKDMNGMYKSGLVEKTDADRIRLQLSSTTIQRDRMIDMNRVALIFLKLQMGMNVTDSILLTDKLEDIYGKSQVPVEASFDASKRVEMQFLDKNLEFSKKVKKGYQMGYAPSLSAFITHQENTFGPDFGSLGKTWYPGTFWGLNLSVPIFDGFRKSNKIQQASIDIAKMESLKHMLENGINAQVVDARSNYLRSGQQLKVQEENLQLAQDIYTRVNLKYSNGLGSSLELTQAQGDLEKARAEYLKTVYDHFVSQLELKRALGTLN